MKKITIVLFFCLSIFASASAQMSHDTKLADTDEKIVIHHPTMGETVVLIARTYKVRPQDIYEYNPTAVDGVTQGMVLRIPLHRQVETVKFNNKENDNFDLLKKQATAAGGSNDAVVNAQQGVEAVASEVTENQPNVKAEPQVTIKSEETEATHQVLAGETLFGLARRYGTTVDAITKANKKKLRHGLQIGQELQIPGVTAIAEASGNTAAIATEASPATDGAVSTIVEHTVQPGETLTGLARKYNTTIIAITEDNKAALKRGLQAGQTIKIVTQDY